MGSISQENLPQAATGTERFNNHAFGSFEPVAIIGMAMRLPGSVKNSEEFWNFLVEKRSGMRDVPKDRFNINGFYHPSGKPGTIPQNRAYYLDDTEIQDFDPSVFPIGKKELERLDPAQRQILQIAYECMEDAGVSSFRGSNLGCYVGTFGEDWLDINAKENQHRGGYRGTGWGDFVLANRISYEFDLHGPSMTVKTACSSSLVCLDMACEAIRNGECDGALVGGTSLMFSPTAWQTLHDQGLLSPTGECRTFDAAANGYARGEAINMIYVKRLKDALRDKDSIRAVIRGTAVNTDGRTQGMTTPSPTAQATLIRRTYEVAGIRDLSHTAVVECHGTGTPVGDPIETEAVASCFGTAGVTITGVKPNVGHSEGAAGVTSIIKSVLALEHRQIPPNINFKTPNPAIPFERFKLHVPTELEEWPQDRAERVSVNSFGIGGVNAHVILDSVRQFELDDSVIGNGVKQLNGNHVVHKKTLSNGTTHHSVNHNGLNTPKKVSQNGSLHESISINDGARITSNGNGAMYTKNINGNTSLASTNSMTTDSKEQNLLLFSAYSAGSLEAHIDAFKTYTQKSNATLHDMAYTLANRREQKPHRAYAVAGNVSTLEVSATQVSQKTPPRVVWVFTGQGAQWPEMGAELIDTNPTFRATIHKLDKFLLSLPTPPSWTIEGELRKVDRDSQVHRAEFGHPLSIALQIALIDVLYSWGIKPDAVLGHSSGEMSAAYASGAITAEGAMAAATFRGTSNVSTDRKGAMAAIGLGRDEVTTFLVPGVVIACDNSQLSVTIAGDIEGVEHVIQRLKVEKPGILARLLRVEKAFHSPHMADYGPSYEKHLQPFVLSVDPKIPFYSSVTGKRLTGHGTLEASYWRQNMESPVLFNTSLRAALHDALEKTVLIEIGPHPALGGPIGQILRDIGRSDSVQHVGSLVRNKSCQESLLHLAGKLFQQNVTLHYSVLCPPANFVRDLPRYSWKKDTSHWLEPRVSHEWRFREYPPHELLGARVFETATEPCWRKILALEDVPWLAGHEVNGQIVLPAAGYISMVGEALRQLEGEATYSLRNVRIAAARVLEVDTTVELLTSLKPIMIDTSENSPWYTFTISSYDGTKWTKNVTGEARASMDKSISLDSATTPLIPFHRKVNEDAWYSILTKIGLNYTSLFRGMRAISADTSASDATATVPAIEVVNGGRYSLHPAVIDLCFQVFTVAAARGLGKNMNQLVVPTFIGEMVVAPCSTDLDVSAKLNTMCRGSFVGDMFVQSAGMQVLHLKDFRTSALTSGPEATEEHPLISQLQWKPHSDFADLNKHMHPLEPQPKEWHLLEELILLCTFDHLERLKILSETPQHLSKFLDWMHVIIQRYKSGANVFVSKDMRLEDMDSQQRLVRIEELVTAVSATRYVAFSNAIHRLFKAAPSIFTGETHPLHVLLEDNALAEFYNTADVLDYAGAIQLIGNTNPRLRVLEVGAGTGGTSAKILEALKTTYGERLYSQYKYTDISSGFMTAAKKRFADFENIEYAVLDVSKDPFEQGFQPGSFDLIVGANVIHATPSLPVTLRHLHDLLSPGGRLFLEELCPNAMFVNYVMGFLQGWWLGAEDNRAEEPYISPERWAKELVAAGFQAPEACVLDYVSPYQTSAGIIASRQNRMTKPAQVTLLCHATEAPYVAEMRHALEYLDITVDICQFGQELPAQDVISLLDLEESTVHDMSEHTFKSLIAHLKSLQGNMVWVTKASQIDCEDPRAAMILGLTRTARNEMSLRLFTVEVDSITPRSIAAEAVAKILFRTKTPDIDLDNMNPDYEFAISNGEILIPRLHWQTMSDAFTQSEQKVEVTSKKQIDVKTPGLLHTMHWTERKVESPGEGEVLVQAKAAGLNFRDLMISLGVLNNNPEEMGFEGSGIVQAVGSGVQTLHVGDRVLYMGSGCFSTHLTIPETLCSKIDSSMSFEQAAVVPGVYTTAVMALIDKANLQQGQSILIHSACGGVGLAAIQIAQMVGSEIYCTVSSEVKIQYLVENYGIDRSRIFNSRDSSFLADIMRVTNNRGVDLVLNSLSGDLLHASWMCVAEFGTMVEIGKRDFQRRAKLTMEPFEQNRTFIGFDIWQVSQIQKERTSALLARCVKMIQSKELRGPPIDGIVPASQIRDAFRTMQTARHIGKIVVKMPDDPAELESAALKPKPDFRADRSYLLVGGLGGLGRSIATWMVENGARHLIFLSRSARVGQETQSFLDELNSLDCQIQLVAGSVSNMSDVKRAVENAAMPVAGVIQMSMVLKDVGLKDMTYSDWTTAVEPKVQGTWNLHNATTASDLDFFILFSSYGGFGGHTGQANYAAGNTFLDAFVQYRHRNGLVASVIDVGVMADVGFVARTSGLLERLEKTVMRPVREIELLETVDLAKERSKPISLESNGDRGYENASQILLGLVTTTPISSPQNRVTWKRDMRMSIYYNLDRSDGASTGSSSENQSLRSLLASENMSEATKTLTIAKAIGSAVANFLIKDEESIPLDKPLENLGMDSLVAMEVRNWIRQQVGVETSTITIVQSPSLMNLAEDVKQKMAEKTN